MPKEMRNKITPMASARPVLNCTKPCVEDIEQGGGGGAVGAAVGEDEDLVERLQPGQRGDDPDEDGVPAQQRPADVPEAPPRAGTVDGGRFDQVQRERLESGQVQDDALTEELPDTEGQDGQEGQRWRRREVSLREPEGAQDAVDDTEIGGEEVAPYQARWPRTVRRAG